VKLIRYFDGREAHWGSLEGHLVYRLAGDPFGAFAVDAAVGPLEGVRLLPPCVPTKIIAIGLNFRPEAPEGQPAVPDEPIFSFKPPSAVIGPGDAIVWPRSSQRVDFEGELALVIGKPAKNVELAEASRYILGITCGNDVTARDYQRREGQWAKAKGFDTFCPLGPAIATGIDPVACRLEVRVGGAVRQSAAAADLHFSATALVSYLSKIMTLMPGDVILTGTPPGSGPLRIGETVEVEIPEVGTLRNRVTAEG
jgi:2-keto-4-pentenoate hydratase/2-oxohepta-3-ene-1,7-dioic acid hydratase in catechol pathway